MLSGKLLPRPLSTLASVVAVTFIGTGKLPVHWLKSTFTVRRAIVREALVWLKANNTKHFGDVEISAENMDVLPEDDVPDELLAAVRQETDRSVLEQEMETYVPSANDDGTEDCQFQLSLQL
jgi:hypothetical protein